MSVCIEKTCDIVVCGGGGAGIVAAAKAASLGKKVILLEKTNRLGGGLSFASAARTFGSRWQKERGLPDVTALFVRNRMNECYWRLDPQFVSNLIRGTGAFFDFLCDEGGPGFGDQFIVGRYVFDSEADGQLGPQTRNGPGGGKRFGAIVVETMSEACERYGAELLTGYTVKELKTSSGRISEVIAEQDGQYLKIHCDACVLATGSWINNKETMKARFPEFLAARPHMYPAPHLSEAYTGDGLSLAQQVGAKIDTDNFVLRLMGPVLMFNCKSKVMRNMTCCPFTLMFNLNGRRFTAESPHNHYDLFDSGNIQMQQPEGLVFTLFNKENLEAAVAYTVENPPNPKMEGDLEPFDTDMDANLADIRVGLEQSPEICMKADTISELAALTGADFDSLETTIKSYNEACASGMDWECFKDSRFLIPMTPPFYVARSTLRTDGAFGGVAVNPDMNAYAQNGGTVPGLFVAGDFASGRHINLGNLKRQVLNDMSAAMSGGFIAGESAARYVDQLH